MGEPALGAPHDQERVLLSPSDGSLDPMLEAAYEFWMHD